MTKALQKNQSAYTVNRETLIPALTLKEKPSAVLAAKNLKAVNMWWLLITFIFKHSFNTAPCL